MSNDFATAFLGLALGIGLPNSDARATSPLESAVAAPTASAPDGRVEVKVEESFSNAETTRGWVEEQATRTLDVLEPGLEAGDSIRILVRGGAFDYRISLVLVRQGEPLATEHQPSELECACGSDEMLEKVAEAIETGARVLSERAEQARKDAAAEAEARPQEREEIERRELSESRYRPSKLGSTGIGVLFIGGAVLIGGIVMTALLPRPVNQWQAHERDWSLPGATMIGLGVTAMTAGLTTLVVDAVRCRRNPKLCGTMARSRGYERAHWAMRRAGGAW